ncbi:MAG: transglycosylase SLT domain-containing protein [Gemmatimonadota bacterium]
MPLHFPSARRLGATVVLALSLAQPCVLAAQVADSVLLKAEQAMRDGRPWLALQLLAPALRAPADRTQARVLTAARASAAWQGWATVGRLLAGESWLDGTGGEGRALLARSALERGLIEPAIAQASMAVGLGTDGPERGERLVVLGRALDRAGQLDSAGRVYIAAADRLPLVADWLLLRAAGVTTDSGARVALYARISLPVARERIGWTEALTLDRAGLADESARAYVALGAKLASYRVRLKARTDSAARDLRRELIGFLAPGLNGDDTRSAIDLLDARFAPLTTGEDLQVARRAAQVSLLPRAAQGYSRANRAGMLTERDHFAFGTVLSRLGRFPEAIQQFGLVRSKELEPEALYQRGRALLRSGRLNDAIPALDQVAAKYPSVAAAAAAARFLAADLFIDKGLEDSARARFTVLGQDYPAQSYGRRAKFQAAVLAFVASDYRQARTEFESLAEGSLTAEEAAAGLYWSGRAALAAGDSAAASTIWRQVVDRAGFSYYAVPAANRLGRAPWTMPPAVASPAPAVTDDSGFARAAFLERLGMKVEARLEYDRLLNARSDDPADLSLMAAAFARAGYPDRALRFAERAVAKGAPMDRTIMEWLYPLPNREVFFATSAAASVDPFLIAGLIRQESAFDPRARSVADARGWMQVLPSVGAELAKASGLNDWDPLLLYQSDLNLDFGIRHFQDALARYKEPAYALAAYNAGTLRVDRWLTLPGVQGDVELFIERIPFAETRDYVRRVLRNQAYYRSLYGDW